MNDIEIRGLAEDFDEAYKSTMETYIRALACHCECLGMNAENSFAICLGKQIPYNDDNYLAALRKWELIDEKGNPTI